MQGRRWDLDDRLPPTWYASNLNVIVGIMCTWHIRMDNVDHAHHSQLIA